MQLATGVTLLDRDAWSVWWVGKWMDGCVGGRYEERK